MRTKTVGAIVVFLVFNLIIHLIDIISKRLGLVLLSIAYIASVIGLFLIIISDTSVKRVPRGENKEKKVFLVSDCPTVNGNTVNALFGDKEIIKELSQQLNGWEGYANLVVFSRALSYGHGLIVNDVERIKEVIDALDEFAAYKNVVYEILTAAEFELRNSQSELLVRGKSVNAFSEVETLRPKLQSKFELVNEEFGGFKFFTCVTLVERLYSKYYERKSQHELDILAVKTKNMIKQCMKERKDTYDATDAIVQVWFPWIQATKFNNTTIIYKCHSILQECGYPN